MPLPVVAMTLASPPLTGPYSCDPTIACRVPGDIHIQEPDGTEKVVTVDRAMRWISDGTILLMPGEWIIVRLVDDGGTLTPVFVEAGSGTQVREPTDGEIRLRAHPFQNGGLMLDVLSRHPVTLDYAAVVAVGEGQVQQTSVCSLLPGKSVFEMWKWPIRPFALTGFVATRKPGCKTIDLRKNRLG